MYLIAVLLGAAFLHPLFERVGRNLAKSVVLLVLVFTAVLPVFWMADLAGRGMAPVVFHTAGFQAPVSISLRVGIEEAVFLIMINAAALFGGIYLMLRKSPRWEGKVQVLFLTMLLGVNGLVLTRDLFNVFVFLEISSISLYALLAFAKSNDAYEAGFKYMVAGGIASALFLIGFIYLYRFTGTLNLDVMISAGGGGPGGMGKAGLTALFLLAAAVLIELKPFPANGWGADAYQAADPGISAMISAVSATGIFFVFYKITPLLGAEILRMAAISGGITFAFSQLLAMKQVSVRRMLGYSSIGQIGLLTAVAALAPILTPAFSRAEGSGLLSGLLNGSLGGFLGGGVFPLLVLLAGNHLFSKAGLFWMSGITGSVNTGGLPGRSSLRRAPAAAGLQGLLTAALAGFPPFPAFWAKWLLIMMLVSTGSYVLSAVILLGSLIEAWYLFRWFLNCVKKPQDTGNVHDEEIPDDFAAMDMDMDMAMAMDIPKDRELQPDLKSGGVPVAGWGFTTLFAPLMHGLILAAAGTVLAFVFFAGTPGLALLLPLAALALFTLLDSIRVPFKLQVFLGIAVTAAYGLMLLPGLVGIRLVFGLIFIAGSAVQMVPLVNRKGSHAGLMGMLTALVFSLGNLLFFRTRLEFFFSWELMTVTSFFLVSRGNRASGAALRYLVFSLGGAFMILAGLALSSSGMNGGITAALMGLGFLVKMGALGLHIWLPGSYAETDDDLSTFFSSVLSKAGLFMLFMTVGLLAQASFAAVLGWIGVLTAFAGAFLALFKEDIKYTLAYSSMGQVGYMLLSFALMSQLGWMNSLYLAVTHLLFKGMMFAAIAGVIYRTKTRMMYQMGGLISRMPISFFTVLIGIIALSGVPPLVGFGAKWMLYTALIEKGWYLQAGIAMFASGVAFLYLFRLIHVIFLGQLKDEHREVKEAPLWFLVPQFIGIIGIMLFSMFPDIILKPLQAAVAPFFSGDILWEGYTVISTLGYWNGNAVMYVTMGVFLVPLAWLLTVQRRHTQKVGQFNIVYAAERPYRPETTHFGYNFFSPYRKALGFLLQPAATRFWYGISSIAEVAGASIRKLYSGNVQTYSLWIVLYVSIFLLLLQGGV
jgi:formate hydrogenlyase subunit 3/multisubunit Na+/H+ antiporter MnhD subunit